MVPVSVQLLSIPTISVLLLSIYTNNSAGFSGVDSTGSRRLCISFQNASDSADLCNSLASIAKKLCTTYVDPRGVAPLTACCLIALDKCPGVRPIGVGETSQRIIGKAILVVIKHDILVLSNFVQVRRPVVKLPFLPCIVSSMTIHWKLYYVLVDATNAFNSLNRQAALQTIHYLCLPLATCTVLTNTYREDTELFIDGETLLCWERTTKGDPLAMAMYAVGILILFNQLKSVDAKQAWFADDATAGNHIYTTDSRVV